MEFKEIITFKRDTTFRKQFFVPNSFAHPAKMDAHLLIWIVEHYTEAGETILDPMAGSGTTMLACGLGRNVVLVELEEKFCKMIRDNWERVKMKPQLGSTMGACQIIQGDARQLENILCDKIITSPPYTTDLKKDRAWMEEHYAGIGRNPKGQTVEQYVPPEGKDNIANLPYGQIDKIVTSPPYEEAMGEKHHSPRADKLAQEKSYPVTYTERVDSIITSPPYEGTLIGSDSPKYDTEEYKERMSKLPSGDYSTPGRARAIRRHESGYSVNDDNIGNLKSDSYLEAMLQVYQGCFSVLKPGGLMILVTKNFIRDQKEVRLDLDTIKLCEQVGFTFKERWHRKLPAQSFWRIIYKQKYPDAPELKYEDVLVYLKA